MTDKRIHHHWNLEGEVARLEGVIASALHAMDEGRYGDVRRILKTGKDEAVKARSDAIVPKVGPG